MKSVLVLQHTACESLGSIEDALRKNNVGFSYVRTDQGERVPHELGDAAGLIVMGGPMGVYDAAEFPFLRDEIRLIESTLKSEKPVLGVCLGSQLLAAALGAKVAAGPQKELGWYPVTLTQETRKDALFTGIGAQVTPFHWHGDQFELPSGAVRLASSQLTQNQAFRYGAKAYGILFHLEVTEGQISQMLIDFAGELAQAGGNARKIERQTREHLPALQPIASMVFGRWASFL